MNLNQEKGWPKIIYDALRRIIPFVNTECDRLLFLLINTPEFQRFEPDYLQRLIPDAPRTVINAFLGKVRLDLAHYLALDDSTIIEFVKACQKGRDHTLHILGEGIIERRLFKSIGASGQGGQNENTIWQDFIVTPIFGRS
ncbi:MAG: hypothetical protein K6U80_04655 [Firmicutes bacterium]|nr:hypothetical protein [Bacillota bacterium]